MKGQTIGYIRVSSFDQNEGRQLEKENLDRVFTDKASGKDTNRPQLQELLQFVREGDLVLVHSMDRLARNLDDLRKLVKQLTSKSVSIKFVKEGLTFSHEDESPMSNLLLSVMGAFAEFERSLIKERQREGIELAKKKGVYKGRKPSLTDEQIDKLIQRAKAGENKSELAKEFGISRQTLYGYIKVN
jgi:DNA invertase Pin-like site-specific DNA recombinase